MDSTAPARAARQCCSRAGRFPLAFADFIKKAKNAAGIFLFLLFLIISCFADNPRNLLALVKPRVKAELWESVLEPSWKTRTVLYPNDNQSHHPLLEWVIGAYSVVLINFFQAFAFRICLVNGKQIIVAPIAVPDTH